MKAICNKFPHTILALGPSGSGKDTQIDLLAEKCGYEKIGTGEMFREEYEKGSDVGVKAYKYWGKGIWVPDDVVYELFAEYMKRFDAEKPWIFSQVVRTSDQVSLFDDLLGKYGRSLDKVIYFSLSDEDAIERMSLRRHCPVCGREYHLKYKKPENDEVCDDDGTKLIARVDDNPDAILSRLKEFQDKVLPIVKTYSNREILLEVDAAPSIENIHKSLMNSLSKSK